MFAYATVGTNNFEKSVQFFDAVMKALGLQRTHDYSEHGWLAYGLDAESSLTLWLCKPHNQLPATAGNGSMVGFQANSRAKVDAFHAAALANGGTSEGDPGLRENYGPDIYVAYVRDPEGNKFSAICRGKAA
jgi:catechol 2,3-dioxygenase-like lactoylglutathione lyase family enzyme